MVHINKIGLCLYFVLFRNNFISIFVFFLGWENFFSRWKLLNDTVELNDLVRVFVVVIGFIIIRLTVFVIVCVSFVIRLFVNWQLWSMYSATLCLIEFKVFLWIHCRCCCCSDSAAVKEKWKKMLRFIHLQSTTI